MKYVSEEVLKRGLEWTLKEHHPLIEWFLNHGCEELPQDPWQKIEVEGLPEGCEAVAVHFEPNYFNKYTGDDGYIYFEAKVKVKKIQPRRIVFEETNEYHEPEDMSAIHTQVFIAEAETAVKISSNVKWKQINETDITLTNDKSNEKINVFRGGYDPSSPNGYD